MHRILLARRRADAFDSDSAIGPGRLYCLQALTNPDARTHLLVSWTDITSIRSNAMPSPFQMRWTITTPQVALYPGNIDRKQNLESIVDVAHALHHRRDPTFVVCCWPRPALQARQHARFRASDRRKRGLPGTGPTHAIEGCGTPGNAPASAELQDIPNGQTETKPDKDAAFDRCHIWLSTSIATPDHPSPTGGKSDRSSPPFRRPGSSHPHTMAKSSARNLPHVTNLDIE